LLLPFSLAHQTADDERGENFARMMYESRTS
jgi:hypothetical protein